MRGLPPRALRPRRRIWGFLLRRSWLLVLPLTLAASTYFVSSAPQAEPLSIARASLVPPPIGIGERPVLEKEPASPELPLQRVKAAAFPLAVRRVVLDAGHGGKDIGTASGPLQEKDVTLDIGHRLRTLLEQNGFQVIVTRPDDRTVPLKERASLANGSRSDIFVSIHVNSILKHVSSRGVETYYLGPTNDPKLTELAAAENAVSGYSLADLRRLLDGVYADARRDESRELATMVQRNLYKRLRASDPGLENWGVKRAPFVVLVATDMPAILAEVGCISNKREAVMLGSAEYRQKIAEALFDGIHAYASANDAPQKKGT
jgi:N-acetylmuramoyl-L-alanine amidase